MSVWLGLETTSEARTKPCYNPQPGWLSDILNGDSYDNIDSISSEGNLDWWLIVFDNAYGPGGGLCDFQLERNGVFS